MHNKYTQTHTHSDCKTYVQTQARKKTWGKKTKEKHNNRRAEKRRKMENKKEGEKVKNNCSLSEQLYTLCCASYDMIRYDMYVNIYDIETCRE